MADVNKKVKRIQVPVDMIKQPKQYHELYLFVALKMACVNNKVNIYSKKLLELLQWKDRKTLKKYLESLKSQGYINYEFKDFPIHSPLQIDIVNSKKQFTQVDTDTINSIKWQMSQCKVKRKNKDNKYETIIEDLKEMAMKLFYYYETYYNADYGYAFPSYKLINQETGISTNYIKILNKNFNRYELVQVDIGDKYQEEDDEGNTKTKRERNKYAPMCKRK